ncbi:MAG TPA: hypothetical protein VFW87_06125, partial [Pirellulales bacterium]|nr:hypothetical protein [Pirellulales bacterium]
MIDQAVAGAARVGHGFMFCACAGVIFRSSESAYFRGAKGDDTAVANAQCGLSLADPVGLFMVSVGGLLKPDDCEPDDCEPDEPSNDCEAGIAVSALLSAAPAPDNRSPKPPTLPAAARLKNSPEARNASPTVCKSTTPWAIALAQPISSALL